jgi:hypothetical protein
VIATVTRAMTNRPIRLAFGLPILAASLLLAAPGVALADCMMPPPIEQAIQQAEMVFVGTVSATSNRNTWAEVAVEEVWKGPDQQATVVVRGGPAGNAATSVDRTFEVGVKYVFFPYLDAAALTDNSCTSTTPWSDGLAALRPSDARKPLAAETASGGFATDWIVPVGLAIVVFGGLLVVGLLARGRQDT